MAFDWKEFLTLAEHLRQHGRATAAIWLGRLRQWRNQCDYDSEVTKLSVLATDAIGYARSLIEESIRW